MVFGSLRIFNENVLYYFNYISNGVFLKLQLLLCVKVQAQYKAITFKENLIGCSSKEQ